jgi:hypothetical protein
MNQQYSASPLRTFSNSTLSQPSPPAGQGIKGKLSTMFSATPYPIMIMVAVILLVTIIVFITLRLRRGAFQSVNLLKTSVIKANSSSGEHYSLAAGRLPSSTNGNEFSVSLWIFVENVTVTNDHKIIMYRGNPTSYNNGKMFVYMDKRTNTLYASVRTNGALQESQGTSEPTLENIRSNSRFLQSTIDYVPLQRWVHVIYSVKDTTLSTFVDGDLYSVTSVYELPTLQSGGRPIPVRQEGDVLLGGNSKKEGLSGYIGNSKYFNFAISIQDAKLVYKKGPYRGSWLQFIGMGNVGFRSPIYRIGTEAEDVK